MKRVLLFMLLVLLSIQLVQAQRMLYLKKHEGKRKYQFAEGERLKLKLLDSGEVLQGSWGYIDEDTIWLSGQEVKLPNIRWVDVSGKESGIWILRKGQDLLLLAGLGYLTVSQLNNLIYTGKLRGHDQDLKISAAMLGGGLACRALDRTLRTRKVRVDKNFSMYILD